MSALNPGSLGGQIYHRLLQGYENPQRLLGAVQFEISDTAERFFLTFCPDELTFHTGEAPNAAARVTMSEDTAAQVATGPNLDLASEDNWDKLRAEGDLTLIGALAQLTKRPRADAVERFRRSEESARSRPRVETVVRLSRPSGKQVRELVDAGQPLIVTDYLAELWPVGARLDFATLRAEYGTIPVRTTAGSMPITEVLDLALSGTAESAPYTLGAPAPPVLLAPFPPPFTDGFDADRFGPAQIWLGSAPGAVSTPLHRDSSPAFLGQIVGSKEWIIYAPDEAANVYAMKSFNRDQPCWVDVWDPDYERYPRLKDAHALRFTLRPGEMSIIPPGWFHSVKALDVTLSIGFHYDPVADFGALLG